MNISRRKFIGQSAAVVGGTLLHPLSVRSSAHVAGSDTLKVALIGSGARGAGAVRMAFQTEGRVELVAMADIFRDRIDRSYDNLMQVPGMSDRIKVPEEHKFVGLDSYKKAIELADVVILASPPAFRPFHFEAAVDAGKHVFMEKPLACDAPGVRKILAAGKIADEKGLKVVVGLQNRYGYRQNKLIEQIKDGRIGTMTSARVHYLISDITLIPREENQTELEYQLRNWRHFCWLWGGSPAALTIHFTDVVNWAKDAHPVRAFGSGGRSVFSGPARGDVFDNFYIEFEYADGMRLHSATRHVPEGWTNRGFFFQGTKGEASGSGDIKNLDGDIIWSYEDEGDPSAFQLAMNVFFESVREDIPRNDTEWGANSTMTDLMGRMAVHSGHMIEWDEALNSDVVLVPEHLSWDSEPPSKPNEDGSYSIPVPGSKSGIV
jgi:myo-inositol 2-dehydrogenase / D-chiro-inositol 1-dehydrogenase